MNDGYQLLTVEEAATALHVSPWMTNRLIQSGRLASLKIGSRRLVRPEAIAEYAASQEQEATDAREAQISRFRRRVSG